MALTSLLPAPSDHEMRRLSLAGEPRSTEDELRWSSSCTGELWRWDTEQMAGRRMRDQAYLEELWNTGDGVSVERTEGETGANKDGKDERPWCREWTARLWR